jgi:hypothetical protein
MHTYIHTYTINIQTRTDCSRRILQGSRTWRGHHVQQTHARAHTYTNDHSICTCCNSMLTQFAYKHTQAARGAFFKAHVLGEDMASKEASVDSLAGEEPREQAAVLLCLCVFGHYVCMYVYVRTRDLEAGEEPQR